MKTYTKDEVKNDYKEANEHIRKITEKPEMYVDKDDLIKDWEDYKKTIRYISIMRFGYEWTEENLRTLS